MKAILNDKLLPLLEQMKGKLPPLPTSISSDHLRRAGMGAGLGIIFVLFLSLFMAPSPSYEKFTLDAENLSLSDLFPKEEEPKIDPSSTFSHFMQNKKQLSEDQKAAITNNETRLTLVVYGLGKQKNALEAMQKKLSPNVTVALSSNTPTYNVISRQLKDKGFETWVSVSTQTLALNEDNGSKALSPSYDFEANIAFLEDQINGKSNITGIMIPPSSLLVESSDAWGSVSQELFAEGFGIFDPTEKAFDSNFFYYQGTTAPYIKGDVAMNTNTAIVNLETKLKDITERTKLNKNLIVSTSIYTPAALDILVKWVDSLQAEGITLIPLSAQAKL